MVAKKHGYVLSLLEKLFKTWLCLKDDDADDVLLVVHGGVGGSLST